MRALTIAMALVLVTGCAHLHWPGHHAPPPPPAPVHELDMSGAGEAGFPQYWKRNTLLVDLRGASGSGSAVMKPIAGTTWPVRLGFRVTPGAFGTLEVRGEQRVLLPISASGAAADRAGTSSRGVYGEDAGDHGELGAERGGGLSKDVFSPRRRAGVRRTARRRAAPRAQDRAR